MKTKQLIALAVAAGLFIVTGAASVISHKTADRIVSSTAQEFLTADAEFAPPAEDYIGIVDIVGTIQEESSDSIYEGEGYKHTTNLKYIDSLIRDSSNKAMLLYVDSPGGTVYESQEMYDKVMEYKEKTGRPVYAYMAHYGASGAYMISMAADRIYVNQNTTTGSIGVIMSGYDMSGLYEKLGIKNINITSGKNKAATFSKEQIEIYQSQVDESYDEFVEIVARGRDMSEKKVRRLADGRTYTAKQAVRNGLVDEIASYEEAEAAISKEAGTTEYYRPESNISVWASLFSKVEKLLPKSDSQVLAETAEKLESGVFMYYAEL